MKNSISYYYKAFKRELNRWWINGFNQRPNPTFRERMLKETWRRFHPPFKFRGKKSYLMSKSQIGKRYYNKQFPSWIMWSEEEPNNLFINVDMFVYLAEQERFGRTTQLDLAKVEAYKILAKDILLDFFRDPRQQTPEEVKYHYATSRFQKELFPVTPCWWFKESSLETIKNFDIGPR